MLLLKAKYDSDMHTIIEHLNTPTSASLEGMGSGEVNKYSVGVKEKLR